MQKRGGEVLMTVNYAIAQGGRGGTVLRMTVKYAERARGGT
jgi:hypothetical protein